MKFEGKVLLLFKLTALTICFFAIVLISPDIAKAKTTNLLTMYGKNDSQTVYYDLDRNGKADKITAKVRGDGQSINSISIYVNNKKNLSFKEFPDDGLALELKVITATNKAKYLYLSCIGSSDDAVYDRLYIYDGKKLKCVSKLDSETFANTAKGLHHIFVSDIKIQKNTMAIKYYGDFNSLGMSEWTLHYKLSKGKFVRQSKVTGVTLQEVPNKKLVTAKKIKVLKNYKNSSKCFYITKDNKVTFIGLLIYKNTYYAKIKYKNKTGYISCNPISIFKDIYGAG